MKSTLLILAVFAVNATQAQWQAIDSTEIPVFDSPEPIEAPVERIFGPNEPERELDESPSSVENVVKDNPLFSPFNFNQENKSESYPDLSPDGLEMFFVHNQSRDWVFYVSRKSLTDAWSIPIPISVLGAEFSPDGEKIDEESNVRLLSATFDPAGDGIYLSGIWNGVAHVLHVLQRKDLGPAVLEQNFDFQFEDENGNPSPPSFITSMSFSHTTDEMFAYSESNLACYQKVGDQTLRFQYNVVEMGHFMGKITPDGLNLILTPSTKANKISRQDMLLIKRETSDQKFDLTQVKLLVSIKAGDCFISQPSYCVQTKELAFVVCSGSRWDNNNIFFTPVDLDQTLEPYHFEIDRFDDIDNVVEADAVETVFTTDNVLQTIDEEEINDQPVPVSFKNAEVIALESSSGVAESFISLGMPFPNPANNEIHFYYQSKGLEANETTKVFVHDQAGKLVLESSVPSGNGESTLNLASLAPGIYNLSAAVSGMQTKTVPFIIAR